MDWGRVGEIIIGSIPAVSGVIAYLFRIDRKLNLFMVEHEMLMQEYVQSKGMRLKDLPTRSRQ